MKLRSLALSLILVFCSGELFGQEFTGRVSDNTGAIVVNATITAHNVDSNTNISTVSTSSGTYTIPYLKPGNYTVSATAGGFEKMLRTGINLQVGQEATVNFVLKVGHITETVTVSGDALVDFAKSDIGEVVENTRVTELPLNGRDPNMLSLLNAGVNWSGSIVYQRPFDNTMESLSINGGGASYNALLLDGVSNEAAGTNNTANSKIAYQPPIDAVQEFKIVTNPYDARYGRLAGGAVDMDLKTGTNKIHGDAYEFARRTYLDANTWQNDDLKIATPKMSWNQYGAELDGPLTLPKVYKGTDKTFFLLQYENFHEIQPVTIVTSVPDPKWITGDFSNLTWYNGSAKAYQPITIYDPLTYNATTNARQPFSGNIINRTLDPVAVKIMSYYPKPNLTPASGTNPFANNYDVQSGTSEEYRNVLAKIDHNFSANDRASLRYGYWERYENSSSNGMPGPISEGSEPLGERSHTFALEETHTVTPNFLLDFRGVVAVRADFQNISPSYNSADLGWNVTGMGAAAAGSFPYMEMSEFAYVGDEASGNGNGLAGNTEHVSNSLSLLPTFTYIKGQHSLRGGLDVRFMQSAVTRSGGGAQFWVDRTWTQSNYVAADWDSASGNSFASLLLGNPTSGNLFINTQTFWSQHYWAPFFQDDWKVTKKLTLNLGIRYDVNPSALERGNLGDYAFNTTSINPVDSLINHADMPNGESALGGVTFLGVNGNPRSTYALTKTNIQPRAGFAYALDSKTVLRGGIGETFRNPQNGPNTLGYSSTTAYVSTLDGGKTPVTADSLSSSGGPFASGVSLPAGNTLGMKTDLGQGPWFLNPKYKVPNYWNYSLGVERQFLQRDTLSINYVGSRAYNVDSSDNINHISAAAEIPCNPDLGGNPSTCDHDYPANPFQGVNGFQGSSYYNASTIQAVNLSRPFPEFGEVIEYQENEKHSWYNSLQVTGVHKWSKSLTLHGTWTWSKLMDSGGWSDETYRIPSRSLDSQDKTHRVTISGVYLLPVGRGRTFLPNGNRILDGAIGGWELGALYVYETGVPWSAPQNYLHNAKVPKKIESTGYIRGVAACAKQWQWSADPDGSGNWGWNLNTLSFNYNGTCNQTDFEAVPEYGEYTNNIYSGIRIPRDQQFDANLAKNFAIMDDMKLQLRLEAFNVLNHPLWQESYSTNFQDSNFGTIERGVAGQSNLPREVQIAVKVTW